MRHTIRRRDRLRYWFDNTMSRGPIALIGWLFLISVLLIVVATTIVVVAGLDPSEQKRGFFQIAWAGLMRTLDSGTMGGDEGSWPFLFVMLAITLGGIFVVSTLIGVLTTGIEGKLEDLRKGRSFVAEANHTVVLGWSPQIFTILSELVLANENQRRACIAILAENDTAEMLDEIEARIPDRKTTRIVCRTGSPIDPADLAIVNPNASRSVIVLAPETDDPDPYVIKAILALTNGPGRRADPYHIVASLRQKKNFDVARMVGGDEVQLVLAGDLIARVTAQTCRQSGLSVAYTELLDYGGDEIYFRDEPALAGKTFGQALGAYADSAVIGLRFADGRIALNPPMDTQVALLDRIIAISADDDTIRLSTGPAPAVDEAAIRTPRPQAPAPERTLVLGWNERAGPILSELDHYVGPGSSALVVADRASVPEARQGADALPARSFTNLGVTFRRGDTTDREVLDGLQAGGYDHIIVLSDVSADGRELGTQQADARTLITLLHLRDIADRAGQDFSIVSEMLDVRNRELAQATRADDFIVSDKLISLLLTQVSENRELAAVFADLFNPEGSEIYLKPADGYVEMGREVDFYTVLESARRQGQVAIGYRLEAQAFDPARQYGVRLNPRKSERFTLGAQDRVIVLAED